MSGLGQAMWVQSVRDMEHARSALAQAHFDWATYASQQAAEKALKAVLLLAGQPAPPVHDLLKLFDRIVTLGLAQRDELERLRPDLSALVQGWAVSRYPLGGIEIAPADLITAGQADAALAAASRVIEFARGLGVDRE